MNLKKVYNVTVLRTCTYLFIKYPRIIKNIKILQADFIKKYSLPRDSHKTISLMVFRVCVCVRAFWQFSPFKTKRTLARLKEEKINAKQYRDEDQNDPRARLRLAGESDSPL